MQMQSTRSAMESPDADAASSASTVITSDSAAGSCLVTAASSADQAASSAAFITGQPRRRLSLNLPPGYRFAPTDAELIVHFLRPKLAGRMLPLPIFFDERVLNYHPEQLIAKYREHGEDRWFFFTMRERKNANGKRPNRTTRGNGHWNATGCQRPIYADDGALVGCVGTLVFYEASRKKKKKKLEGITATAADTEEIDTDRGKTVWTMYEYESLASEAEFQAKCNGEAKIDGLVLCTIQKKKHRERSKINDDAEVKSRRKRREKQQPDQEASHEMRRSALMGKPKQELQVEAPNTLGLGAELGNTDPNMGMLHCSVTTASSTQQPTSSYLQQMMLMVSAGAGTQISSNNYVHPNNANMVHQHFSQPLEAVMQQYFPYGWNPYTQHMQPNTVAPPNYYYNGFSNDQNHLPGADMQGTVLQSVGNSSFHVKPYLDNGKHTPGLDLKEVTTFDVEPEFFDT